MIQSSNFCGEAGSPVLGDFLHALLDAFVLFFARWFPTLTAMSPPLSVPAYPQTLFFAESVDGPVHAIYHGHHTVCEDSLYICLSVVGTTHSLVLNSERDVVGPYRHAALHERDRPKCTLDARIWCKQTESSADDEESR